MERHDDEGFTLIELMVVVLVIAILLAIAIPTFLGARGRSQDAVAKSSVRNALTAARTALDAGATITPAALVSEEPGMTYTASPSTGPKEVSVTSTGNAVLLAAKSMSGKCFTATVGVGINSEVTQSSQPVCSGATASSAPTAVSGLVLWYDAADPTTMTLSGGSITAWRDKSGNGNNLALSASIPGPTRSVAAVNGLDTASFDGTQQLEAPNSSSLAIAGSGLTVFAVYRDTLGGASTDALLINKEQSWELGTQNDVLAAAVSTATPRNWGWIGSLTSVANQWHAASFRRSASTFVFDVDGTEASLSAAPVGNIWPTADVLTVGGRALYPHRWVGDIAEIVVYNTTLTDAQEQMVRGYLRAKWGTI